MKKTVLFLSLFIIFFSCNHNTEIKKNHAIVKDSIVQKEDTIAEKNTDTISTKKKGPPKPEDFDVIVKLPKNRYALITLEAYLDKEQNCDWLTWSYKPKCIKVFDDKTKKQVPQTLLNNYYSDESDSLGNYYVDYGDFNFDGKMDVAVRGKESGYRNFCYWNFYLATSKGYKFSKSFSEIMDSPIAYFELDAKHKKNYCLQRS